MEVFQDIGQSASISCNRSKIQKVQILSGVEHLGKPQKWKKFNIKPLFVPFYNRVF